MRLYEHGGDIYGNPGVTLDFSVNTNPLGLPDQVGHALVANLDKFARYPDPQCRDLRTEIARHESVAEDWILCGNGAADLIYRLCYAMRPQKALVCAPTFSEYERALEQVGCQVEYHYLKKENLFTLDDKILKRLTPGLDLLFLCHPNNPTGRLISPDLIPKILNRAQENETAVVVDECFLDFAGGETANRYLKERPGLVVLKAFTKIYSLAGLRLGYLLTSSGILRDKVDAAAQCWSVSVPAQIAGLAALSRADWQRQTRRLVVNERNFLTKNLKLLGIRVFPSDANFLLLRFKGQLYEPLLRKGIMIRRCNNFRGLDEHYYRISVKRRPENIQLLKALEEIIHG